MSHNKSIERLLLSIFAQTYTQFEVIVVDSYSTDSTAEVCRKFPITFIQTKSTISEANNIALENGHGDYFLFLDSDMELPQSFLEDCVRTVKTQKVDCLDMAFTHVESRKAHGLSNIDLRNMEIELGAAQLNIYFYSREIIQSTRFPESKRPIVGEEYIFRKKILQKKPKVGFVQTRVLHYYDPSFAWIVRRSWKYGHWFAETRKHLATSEQVHFVHYNSVLKKESIPAFFKLAKKKPAKFFPFAYYIVAKYVSFLVGYLST
jgi:glycosyltransferase involved in cell wall biosynthesis